MTTATTANRFTTPPDEQTLAATVTAIEEHGFSVEVVDGLDAFLEIHQELPGRVRIVLVRRVVGF